MKGTGGGGGNQRRGPLLGNWPKAKHSLKREKNIRRKQYVRVPTNHKKNITPENASQFQFIEDIWSIRREKKKQKGKGPFFQ